jgi:pSer/pThr/pTyr-binding forkhead associated (FHA) protein
VRVILEVAAGSHRGRKIVLRPGQEGTVGRTERADFAFPRDPLMSGLHFDLRSDSRGCVLRDLWSTNGTRVNGTRVTESVLGDGDQITAGETTFVVRIEGAVAQNDGSPTEQTQSALAAAEAAGVAGPSAVVAKGPPNAGLGALPDGLSRPYRDALLDEDPGVRRTALLTAVWTRQPWLLDYCRQVATQPAGAHWDAVFLLAVLGTPADGPIMAAIGRADELGARRFRALGAFGHPHVVPELLRAVESNDATTAVWAGRAFTKITGLDVESEQRVAIQPDDGSDAGDPELLDEAFLPDRERIQREWQRIQSQLFRSMRWCRGFDVSGEVPEEVLAALDMESRFELALRVRYESGSILAPYDVETLFASIPG